MWPNSISGKLTAIAILSRAIGRVYAQAPAGWTSVPTSVVAGQTYTLQWSPPGQPVSIELFRDGEEDEDFVASIAPYDDDGTFDWVPTESIPSGSYRLRLYPALEDEDDIFSPLIAYNNVPLPATSSSVTTGSPTNTPSSSSTANPTNSAAADPNSSSSGGLSISAKVGLGVGLGLGIPLIIAIILAFFFYRRRKHTPVAVAKEPESQYEPKGAASAPEVDSHGGGNVVYAKRMPPPYGQEEQPQVAELPGEHVLGPRAELQSVANVPRRPVPASELPAN